MGVQSLPEGSDRQLTSTDQIEVSPFDVLFTQGNISSSFGPHPHKGIHVDETIKSMIATEIKKMQRECHEMVLIHTYIHTYMYNIT